ncbi:YbaK/EbsC family protein [Candidatus Parcubacteria bacterium]|nr:YbaK/EbsC family protein [Candidatus Parcubacteria bacterium]
MLSKKILNFLEKSRAKYKVLNHRTVYTAFDKSQTLKVSPKIVGKTLILKAQKELIFVLISADKNLDLDKIKKKLKTKDVKLATEKEIIKKIKGVKVGAIPPFGNLWKIKTLIDNSFKKQKKMIINGGDWTVSIEISPKELQKIVPDLIWGNFSKKKK